MSETERLLTDEEIDKIICKLSHIKAQSVTISAELMTAILKAQDSKTYSLAFAAGEKQGFNNAISWAGQLCLEHAYGHTRHIDCVQCVIEKRKELSG